MSAVRKAGKKRPARSAASKRGRPGGAGRRDRRPGTRVAFSIALSLFALPLAFAGLLAPLPAGLAAVLMAGIALVAGRGRKWPGRIAFATLILGCCGLVGGLVIGLTVTAPR